MSTLSLSSLGTTKMVNHFLQKVYKLRPKNKVHMKVHHGARALGYVAFKKYFPWLDNWPIKPINGHISASEWGRLRNDPAY